MAWRFIVTVTFVDIVIASAAVDQIYRDGLGAVEDTPVGRYALHLINMIVVMSFVISCCIVLSQWCWVCVCVTNGDVVKKSCLVCTDVVCHLW